MQAWAKRGLQTALVTGGLLMLGTGIASADEDVNPDKPASPLDLKVRVPIHTDNNALGTPLGQKNLPVIDKDVQVSPGDVVDRVPVANQAVPAAVAKAQGTAADAAPATGLAAPVTDRVTTDAAPVTGKVTDLAAPLTDKVEGATAKAGAPGLPEPRLPNVPEVDGALFGNSIDGDVVVPVDISGNAIAILGTAEVENESHQQYETDETVVTNGAGGFLAGNAVDLDWALPIQINGNAIAGLGTASATSTSSQETTNTSDVVTDGSAGVLSGNVGAVHGATPVQLTGNAIAGGGAADAESEAETTATSGGWVLTSGADGAGTGNVAGVPVATPIRANGNGIAGAGWADAESEATADAYAGDERPGLYNVPTYLETNGDPATAAGNVVQPAVSGEALLCGNAGAAVGDSVAACDSAAETEAGGTNRTTGEGSIASGSIVHPAAALPTQGFGNAVAGGGAAEATADKVVDSTAGGDSYTRGHDSVLSGTTVTGGPSGPVDVFSNAIAGAGTAEATSSNDATTTSGGNTGTTGDDSAGGGNMVTTPLALPVETFGNVAGVAGGAEATAVETKEVTAGGGSNTDDDNGLAASNLVSTPVAGAAQAFGNGAGVVAFTDAVAATDNDVTAGGDNKATGIGGLGSANIGHVPVTAPAQLFGNGGSVLAGGDQAALGYTDLTAGGDTTSDGSASALSGNVVNAPAATAAQAFGDSAAVLGVNDSFASSETGTTTGGTTETDGTASLGSGNVVAPQAMPILQSFALSGSALGGMSSAVADNDNVNTASGDIDTAGDAGFLSGNIADVPAGVVVHPFGNAVALIESLSYASGDNVSESAVGGTSTTSGEWGSLSGVDGTVPFGLNMPIYDIPIEVLAQAITDSTNDSALEVGEGSQLNIPFSGNDASPTRMPSLMPMTGRSMSDHTLPGVPADDFAGSFTGVLDGFADGMAGVPGQTAVRTFADTVAEQPRILPATQSRSHTPFAPISGDLFDLDLPTAGNLPTGGLPTGGLPTGGLPTGGLPTGGLPTGGLPTGGLPTGGLPTGGLPTGGLPTGGLPTGGLPTGGLPTGGLPTGDLPTGDLPMTGDLFDGLPAVPAGRADTTAPMPNLGDLTDVTTPLPSVPATGDLTDVTTIIPTVPAAGGVTSVPVVQAPSLNSLPVDAPALTTLPAVDSGSLTDTRAALANLFTVHPIG